MLMSVALSVLFLGSVLVAAFLVTMYEVGVMVVREVEEWRPNVRVVKP